MFHHRFHIPYSNYGDHLGNLRLVSFEGRKTIADEIVLYILVNGRLHMALSNPISFSRPVRVTRNPRTFYLRAYATNVEHFAPLARMQRSHNEYFRDIDLYNGSLSSFNRQINNVRF